MNTQALIILGIYTLILIVGINVYENKLNNLRSAISDYKRALSLARGSEIYNHYSYLQLEVKNLDLQNQVLQTQIKNLQGENKVLRNVISAGDSKDIQYESSTYKNNTWESNLYANYTELEENPPFIRKYGYQPE